MIQQYPHVVVGDGDTMVIILERILSILTALERNGLSQVPGIAPRLVKLLLLVY